MNFFDHKDLGSHLLQLCPKVVKHPVYYKKLFGQRERKVSHQVSKCGSATEQRVNRCVFVQINVTHSRFRKKKGFTIYDSYFDKTWSTFSVSTFVASLPVRMPDPKTHTKKHFLTYIRSQIIIVTGK